MSAVGDSLPSKESAGMANQQMDTSLLPAETLLKIFSILDHVNLFNACKVNHLWHDYALKASEVNISECLKFLAKLVEKDVQNQNPAKEQAVKDIRSLKAQVSAQELHNLQQTRERCKSLLREAVKSVEPIDPNGNYWMALALDTKAPSPLSNIGKKWEYLYSQFENLRKKFDKPFADIDALTKLTLPCIATCIEYGFLEKAVDYINLVIDSKEGTKILSKNMELFFKEKAYTIIDKCLASVWDHRSDYFLKSQISNVMQSAKLNFEKYGMHEFAFMADLRNDLMEVETKISLVHFFEAMQALLACMEKTARFLKNPSLQLQARKIIFEVIEKREVLSKSTCYMHYAKRFQAQLDKSEIESIIQKAINHVDQSLFDRKSEVRDGIEKLSQSYNNDAEGHAFKERLLNLKKSLD